MAWTIKKEFDGIVAVNTKLTGAVEIKEKDDKPYAIVSSKYDAFRMSAYDMFQLGYLLIEMSGVTDKEVIDRIQTITDNAVRTKKTPLTGRNINLPKREDGCIDLEGENAIVRYIRSQEAGVAYEPSAEMKERMGAK